MTNDRGRQNSTPGRRDYDHDPSKADVVTVARLEERLEALIASKNERDVIVDQRFDEVRSDVRDLKVDIGSKIDGLGRLMTEHVKATKEALDRRDVANETRDAKTKEQLDKISWIVWVQDHWKPLILGILATMLISGTLSNFISPFLRWAWEFVK